MSVLIKQCTFTEISENVNFVNLVEEAAASPEVVIEGLTVQVKVEMYKQMENTGILHILGAYFEDKLIGFSFILFPTLPHHTGKIAVGDTLFVSEEYRKTGAGLKLITATEEHAALNDKIGMLFTTSCNSALERVLDSKRYKKIRHVLYRELNE